MAAEWEIDGSDKTPGSARVRLAGDWRACEGLRGGDELLAALQARGAVKELTFDSTGVTAWDSGLLTFLRTVQAGGEAGGIVVRPDGLPEGAQRLLKLARTVPAKEPPPTRKPVPLLARLGGKVTDGAAGLRESVRFVGECLIAFGRMFLGRAQFRRADLFHVMYECGARALGIVSLISFLVGLILAYIGAIQLRAFGAQIYVADLVAVAMIREMAAIMTAIVMAGRTGAAFAAQLGTMEVNEEIDAFRTMGISPIEFLVLPRMLALVLMMPLLVLYADLMGVLGGVVIGVGVLDLTPMEYFQQTIGAVNLFDFGIGLVKGAVFGVLVAVCGCLRGMQCKRSAQGVGQAATSAVVTGIVYIIVSDAILTVLCDVLGI